jgi:hypothetical protein
MEKSKYKLKSKVLLQDGDPKLHFAAIDKETSDEIKENLIKEEKLSESIAVIATIKTTTWVTALTLDVDSDAFLLPLKLGVRNKENIKADDDISFTLQIKDLIPPQAIPAQEEETEEDNS